jgi:glycosyltransferase involved in cell wall biosynthesis
MKDATNVSVPRVAVLIPTYQGKSFLETQIESILNQKDVIVDIYICDDGSSDGTFELLLKLNSRLNFAALIQTSRIGSTAAFFRLLCLVKDADFVAFSDQDDVWMSNKLLDSVKTLNDHNSELVFSKRQHIDEYGRIIGYSRGIKHEPTWANAAVQNVAFGNTQVLSKKGFEFVRRIGFVEVIHFDAWVYLLIASCYNVSYIDQNLVQYRLHSKNQVGLRKLRHFRHFYKHLLEYEKQVDILLDVAGEEIREDAKRGLTKFRTKPFNVCKYMFSNQKDMIFRQSKLETFCLRLLIGFPLR